MARAVVWTDSAWRDLEEVADYIARDSRYYAASFVQEVRVAARSLSMQAERGRIVPEFSAPAIRELLVKRYRLVYRCGEKNVEVLAFIHGARDLRRFRRPPARKSTSQ